MPRSTAKIELGVVDVLVVSPHASSWRVLVMQRGGKTRCPGAWEIVHGRIERGETPERAALRELREETGLVPDKLYNVTVHAFYVHHIRTVELAAVFCAFVRGAPRVTLGDEHVRYEWLSRAQAARRVTWPSERDALARAWALLRRGNAGVADDVLLIKTK
ncbi:MAG TPA: NUDIX domain-containing protein [Gemmatimonadaceae bacterium]|nr:NUDIX domain-containing protein [Gemmatimonadaceae bacterium]